MRTISTIYDVAEKTGYSPSTVARALSGKGYCGEKTKKIILEAAKQLNYAPVQAAKVLKSKQTKKIMFCIPDIYNPYYFSMIEGANRVLQQYGYYMILVHSEHDKEKEFKLLEVLKEHFVDGMIMGSFDFDEKLIEEIRNAPVPVVITNLYESLDGRDNFDCVYVDHTKATFIATTELIEKGHKNIVFVGGSLDEQTGSERLVGYQKALEAAGLPYREELILTSDFTHQGGRKVFSEFMKKEIDFSGIVAINDLMAIGCMNACLTAGLKIPEDVSVISLDNTDYCACTFPKLSSINMMQEQIGANSAELLIERINGKRDYKKVIVLEPSVVLRSSVSESENNSKK